MPDSNLITTQTSAVPFSAFSAIPGYVGQLTNNWLTQNSASTVAGFTPDQAAAIQGIQGIYSNPGYDQTYNLAGSLAAGAGTPGAASTQAQGIDAGVVAGAGTALGDSGNWSVGQGQGTFGLGMGAATQGALSLGSTASQLGAAGTNLINGGTGISAQYTQPMTLAPITSGTWDAAAANQYMSPYEQTAMSTTMDLLQKQHDVTRGDAEAKSAGMGSFSDRRAMEDAALEGQFATSDAATLAGMANQGYTVGLQGYQADQSRGVQAQQMTAQDKLAAQQLGEQGAVSNAQLGLAGTTAGINALTASGGLQGNLMQAGIAEQGVGNTMIGQGNTAIGNAASTDLAAAGALQGSDVSNRSLALNASGALGSVAGQTLSSDLARTNALAASGAQQQQQAQNVINAPLGQIKVGTGVLTGNGLNTTTSQVPGPTNAQLGLAGALAAPGLVNAGINGINAIGKIGSGGTTTPGGVTGTASASANADLSGGASIPPPIVDQSANAANIGEAAATDVPGLQARGGRIDREGGGLIPGIRDSGGVPLGIAHIAPLSGSLSIGPHAFGTGLAGAEHPVIAHLRRHLAAGMRATGGRYTPETIPQHVVDAVCPPWEKLRARRYGEGGEEAPPSPPVQPNPFDPMVIAQMGRGVFDDGGDEDAPLPKDEPDEDDAEEASKDSADGDKDTGTQDEPASPLSAFNLDGEPGMQLMGATEGAGTLSAPWGSYRFAMPTAPTAAAPSTGALPPAGPNALAALAPRAGALGASPLAAASPLGATPPAEDTGWGSEAMGRKLLPLTMAAQQIASVQPRLALAAGLKGLTQGQAEATRQGYAADRAAQQKEALALAKQDRQTKLAIAQREQNAIAEYASTITDPAERARFNAAPAKYIDSDGKLKVAKLKADSDTARYEADRKSREGIAAQRNQALQDQARIYASSADHSHLQLGTKKLPNGDEVQGVYDLNSGAFKPTGEAVPNLAHDRERRMGPILDKMARGETLSPGDQGLVDFYQKTDPLDAAVSRAVAASARTKPDAGGTQPPPAGSATTTKSGYNRTEFVAKVKAKAAATDDAGRAKLRDMMQAEGVAPKDAGL